MLGVRGTDSDEITWSQLHLIRLSKLQAAEITATVFCRRGIHRSWGGGSINKVLATQARGPGFESPATWAWNPSSVEAQTDAWNSLVSQSSMVVSGGDGRNHNVSTAV